MQNWERHYDGLANDLTDRGVDLPAVITALKGQVIELPSWAVGNSGTRYGVFRQPGAARNIWDKIDDCAEIQRAVGICPAMASHVLWDVTDDGRYEPVRAYAAERGLRIGTVHPNTFMGQEFRLGSICSPIEQVRRSTIDHFVDCVRITARWDRRQSAFGWPTAPTTPARTICAAASSAWPKGCRRCTMPWIPA